MSRLYYVVDETDFVMGPYTLKEALKVQESHFIPSKILKLVVDEQGNEVK